eukprot:CAMPEP_0114510754 /NCGR_PEP_ID=MMETSP0109-20121206/13979_1 /TAXON_ID=29199 /ORGANISM="Chlorarachnion reptans, Strain CCCM449" /LENGTH=378 /DNA_ID=CAMNT_0001690129 /DNA_START=53 /DNA_END=1189 /DNA_ORIENTATION=+
MPGREEGDDARRRLKGLGRTRWWDVITHDLRIGRNVTWKKAVLIILLTAGPLVLLMGGNAICNSSSTDPSLHDGPSRHILSPGIYHLFGLPAQVIRTLQPLINERGKDAERMDIWGYKSVGLVKPLTIQEARMCDPKSRIVLEKGMMDCPEDPTCIKCAEDAQQTYSLMRAWNESRQSRDFVYERILSIGKSEEIIVMAVNSGMLHLWLNWVCGCDEKKIEVRRNTIMVPTDYKSHKIISESGFNSIEPTWTKIFHVNPKYTGKAGRGGHAWINNVHLYTIVELVDLGCNIIAQDVDMIWQHDPRSWLRHTSSGRDILTPLAPRWDGMGPANTGFMYFKSNMRVRWFLKTLMNLTPIKGSSDQVNNLDELGRRPKFHQ